MSQMYLTLPSNSSKDYFPSNTLTNFKTHLAQSLDLGNAGDWEAGLAEIQYPFNWFNMTRNDDEKTMIIGHLGWEGGRSLSQDDFGFPKGYFESADEVVRVLNRILRRYATFKWIPFENYVEVKLKRKCALEIRGPLTQILGLPERLTPIPDVDNTFYHGDRINPHINPIYNMYIYCDLVQHERVGDTMAPLLRILPIRGRHGKFITHTCEDVQYKPLRGGRLDSVEIDIRDDQGKVIPFEPGKLVVVLHVRRRRSPYF